MSKNGAQQKQIMEHEQEMALYQAGLSGQSPGPEDRARFLETVTDSDLTTSDDPLENLNAKDFTLSNFDEDGVDTTEIKWMSEILDLIVKARYPHPGSHIQGLTRAWAAHDSSERRQSLGLGEFAQDESYKLGTFSRAKRGEGGMQQETASKSVSETHAVRDSSRSSSDGLLGRWRS